MDLNFSLTKSKNRLVVEYIVTYRSKSLVFYFLESDKVASFFEYKITDSNDAEKLSALYEQTLIEKKLKPFNVAELVISSFDTCVTNMRIKKAKAIFSGDSLTQNFLLDSYGPKYASVYYVSNQKSDTKDGYLVNSFYLCQRTRVKEIEKLLSCLKIEQFQVSFIGQRLNECFKKTHAISDGYVVYDNGSYSVLSCVKKNQTIFSYFVCNNGRIGNQKTQLSKMETLIAALDKNVQKDGYDFENLTILGNIEIQEKLKGLPLNISLEKDFAHEQLITAKMAVKPSGMIKDEAQTQKKKSRIDWAKFLGIKKGFTLVESIVSIAIFSIVAAITATFILTSTNSNNNTKRSVLAENYLLNVSEAFNADPTAKSVRGFTKYESSDLEDVRHTYYLNSEMDFLKASLSPTDMRYSVVFQYGSEHHAADESIVQAYDTYKLTIVSIRLIDKTNSYIDQTSFTVVN